MSASQWELLVRALLTILKLLATFLSRTERGYVQDTFTDQTIAKLQDELRHGG